METLLQDIRFGVRMLLKSPGFTVVAILSLALGIGANTAVFTFVDALMLRPLAGVSAPDRLVQMARQYAGRAYPSDSWGSTLDAFAATVISTGLGLESGHRPWAGTQRSSAATVLPPASRQPVHP